MMPLSFADEGEQTVIKNIKGKPDVKAHLADLGFVVGGNITIISKIGENVIVNVKDARIAISKEMAMKIYI